ncbi:Uncharacterised protein [Candidatus Gugararchaeum adminiculabundum]|nr:Uncharacterised protein [Candidatus Gugararchaeum adminiculabundum]
MDKQQKPTPAFFVARTEITALLLGVVLVAAALIYLYTTAPHVSPNPVPQAEDFRNLILGSIEKQISADNYTYVAELRDLGTNSTSVTKVTKQGSKWRVDQITGDAEGRTYFSPEKVIVCSKLSNVSEWLCTDSAAVPELAAFAGGAEKNFASARDSFKASLMLNSSAMVQAGNITRRTILGRECLQAEFTVDYKKFSIDELSQLGLSSDSPVVKDVTGLNSTNCYDSKTGFILESTTSFSYKFVPSSSTRVFTSFSDSVPAGAFELPAKLLAKDEYSQLFDIEKKKDDCAKKFNATADVDQCLKTEAMNTRSPVFCAQISDADVHERELCYFLLMQKTSDTSFCPRAGSLSDDCFFEAAKSLNQTGLCANIQNETMKADCTK